MNAVRLWWACEFGAFILLGFVACLAASSIHSTVTAILILFVPLLFIVLYKMCFHGLREFTLLWKSVGWWHALWLLLFLSGLVFRIRDIRSIQGESLDAWGLFRVGLVVLTALLLMLRLVLGQTPWTTPMFQGLVGLLTAYSLLCASSTLWSVYWQWTLYKSLEYLVDVAMLAAVIAAVRSATGYRSLFDWTWTLYGLLLLSVWVGVLIWPNDAVNEGIGVIGFQIEGVFPAVGANSVAEFGAVLAVVALARLLSAERGESQRLWYGMLFAASFITMTFAQGRSAIAGFVLGVVLVLLFSKRVGLSAAIAFGATLLLSRASASGFLWEFLKRGQDDRQIQTLTGRLDWWQFAWQRFLEHPLTGYGAYAAGRSFVMAGFGEDPGSLHSEYAEILVGTGVIGMVLVAATLLATWWWLIRSLRKSSLDRLERRLAVEALGVLAVLSVRSFFSPNLFWHVPLTFFAVLGYAEFLRRRRNDYGISLRRLPSHAGTVGERLSST